MKLFLSIFFLSIGLGCSNKDFKIGDCLIPINETAPTSIIRLLSISTENFLFSTHFLSDGKLIIAEDYKKLQSSEVKSKYSIVQCPKTDGVFSPDKYLNQK